MREVADFVGQKLAPIEGVSATVTLFVLKKYKIEGVVLDEKENVVINVNYLKFDILDKFDEKIFDAIFSRIRRHRHNNLHLRGLPA